MKNAHILLVDDDRNFLRVLSHQIQKLGVSPVPVASGKEALERMEKEKFDLVITDLKMPEMDGIELMELIKARDPLMPVLVLTAHGSNEKAREATNQGACDFLIKPCGREEMQLAIRDALKIRIAAEPATYDESTT